jgi:hypothetical protein
MRLIEELERRLDVEQSFFQSQLLREDIARLARMRDLVSGTADAAAFRKTALRLGWTAAICERMKFASPWRRWPMRCMPTKRGHAARNRRRASSRPG